MDEIKKSIWSSRVLNAVGRLSTETMLDLAVRRDLLRITGLAGDELDEILRDLENRGFIQTGPTINDTYIRLKK